ncbi:PREDICTED: epsin-2-like [Priapulus caudatus]|uniref:Epsin-2-like n=1 Tax=Priapulus caudatus TaxID=37621 RepID=A0ABM1DUB6_PRICU|nr:PREDICTED: epsin-2-like [Priapulus caudatus]
MPPPYSAVGAVGPAPTMALNDPWAAEPVATAAPNVDPFAPTTNGDVDFDSISHRPVTASPPMGVTTGVNGRTSADMWDMGGMEQSLGGVGGGHGKSPALEARSKTPESFLGAHTSLVNLDALVTGPDAAGASTNPFAAPPAPLTSNPFQAQQQQQKVPMNRMMRDPVALSFTAQQQQQQQNPSVLPAPLLPVGTAAGGGGQSLSTNPFL